jgi:hypothetical protein
MTIPSAKDFLTSTPIYNELSYEPGETQQVVDILFYDGSYDSYCTECKRNSTFQTEPREIPFEHQQLEVVNNRGRAFGISEPLQPNAPKGVFQIDAHCTRDSSHHQYFFILAESRTVKQADGKIKQHLAIQKIGQYPSYGDVHISQTRKYENLLPSQHLKELNKAIGLAAHGVGIGSYVYLRRIFESLIEEAHQEAINDQEWEEEKYLSLRINERISLLKHHLPEFLVAHPQVYSILSKGIHELSEDDCLEHFDVLRVSIELILEQRREKRDQQKRMATAKSALQRIFGRLK